MLVALLLTIPEKGHSATTAYLADLLLRVHDERRVLVYADDRDSSRQEPEHLAETRPPHEAATGVVLFSTLVVVPVWHKDQRETERPPKIEAGFPVSIFTDLVDLIDGN